MLSLILRQVGSNSREENIDYSYQENHKIENDRKHKFRINNQLNAHAERLSVGKICRLAYELLQTLRPDAPRRTSSVDSAYWFHFEAGNKVQARYPHTPRRSARLLLYVSFCIISCCFLALNPHSSISPPSPLSLSISSSPSL